jgi:hypothetical protein
MKTASSGKGPDGMHPLLAPQDFEQFCFEKLAKSQADAHVHLTNTSKWDA